MDESREANRTDDDVTARTFFVGDDEEEPDPEIARYESMPIEQVNAELHEHGIDPKQTIAAVADLLRKHLQDRRSLHLQETVLICVAMARVHAIRRQILSNARPWEIGRAAPVRILS